MPVTPAPAPALNVSDLVAPLPGNTVVTGTNDGEAITMPDVSAGPLPVVEGLPVTDRGEEADFIVLHAYCGEFRQGSLIARKDLPETADIARLLKLGALAEVNKEPAAESSTEDDPANQGRKPGRPRKS